MRHIWLKGAMIGAAVLMGSNVAWAEAEATEVVTLSGAALPLDPHTGNGSSGGWGNWTSFLPRGYAGFNEGNSIWVDVGSAKTLSGVVFRPRKSDNSAVTDRWRKFRVWGADVPGGYTSKEGMELVASNYLGVAKTDQTNYNNLVVYEGIKPHRYYYFDNYGAFNIECMELWSADVAAKAFQPVATDLEAGDYTFSGKVTYVSGAEGAQVCVAIADKDYDDVFADWQAKGKVVKASGSFAAGEEYTIAVNGVARGRKYSRVFVREGANGAWCATPRTHYFAARPTLMNETRAYILDTAAFNAQNSSKFLYDGQTANGWAETSTSSTGIIFELDPNEDYASIRIYARSNGENLKPSGTFTCWGRSHGVTGLMATDGDLTFTDATQATWVTGRDLWFVTPANVSDGGAAWTNLDTTKTLLWVHSDWEAPYVEARIEKGALKGKKWLKMTFDNSRLNGREIELYAVKASGLVIRVQ